MRFSGENENAFENEKAHVYTHFPTESHSQKKREILRIKARFSLAVYIYGILWRNVSFTGLKSILISSRKSHLRPFILKNLRALLCTSWITVYKKRAAGVAALFDEMEAYARPAGACGLASVYTSTSRAVAVSSLLASTRIPLCGNGATGERRTNCNTRSPRRFRSYRNRGLPCGNQSEPSESRRQARYGSFQVHPA